MRLSLDSLCIDLIPLRLLKKVMTSVKWRGKLLNLAFGYSDHCINTSQVLIHVCDYSNAE